MNPIENPCFLRSAEGSCIAYIDLQGTGAFLNQLIEVAQFFTLSLVPLIFLVLVIFYILKTMR